MHRPPLACLIAALLTGCATEPPSQPPPSAASVPMQNQANLHPALQRYVEALLPELDAIPVERREALDALARFVIEQRAADRPARLVFICTHNSRRSHMGQLWAATAAAYYGVAQLESYSGGTEATAFNPRAVAAMQRAGFVVDAPPEPGDNPRYAVSFGPEAASMIAFSKTWDDPSNPSEGFAAIMTCTQADEACPFVRGAGFRIAVPYDDPKAADQTPDEGAVYDARARQIAVEMFYLVRAIARADR